MTAEAVHGRAEGPNGATGDELARGWPGLAPQLRGFASKNLRLYGVPSGRLDADDVLQQTWLAMHTAKNPIESTGPYAYTVAGRLILRAARESHRFALTADADELLDAYVAAREQERNSPVEDQVLRREIAAVVAAAKQKLSPAQRVAVEGLVEDQRPRDEVAARQGIAVGTLSIHRARALIKLHAELIAFVGTIAGVIALVIGAVGLLVSGGGHVDAAAVSPNSIGKGFDRYALMRKKQIRKAWLQATGRDLTESDLSMRIFRHLAIGFFPTVIAAVCWVISQVCGGFAIGMAKLGLTGTSGWMAMQILHVRFACFCDRICDRICNRLIAAFPRPLSN